MDFERVHGSVHGTMSRKTECKDKERNCASRLISPFLLHEGLLIPLKPSPTHEQRRYNNGRNDLVTRLFHVAKRTYTATRACRKPFRVLLRVDQELAPVVVVIWSRK